METISVKTIEYIDKVHKNNKNIPAKKITQIINDIIKNFILLADEEKEIARNIICKITENYLLLDSLIFGIILKHIFPSDNDQIWLKNLQKKGYVTKDCHIFYLGVSYYHIIFEKNNFMEIMADLSGCSMHDTVMLKKFFEKKGIKYMVEYTEYLVKIGMKCSFDEGFVKLFPMTIEYIRFLMYCDINLDFVDMIEKKIVTKFSDIFFDGRNLGCGYLGQCKLAKIFNKLSTNGIWPTLEDLNKFDSIGYYGDFKEYVHYFLRNKLINKLSECAMLYGKIKCWPKEIKEIINICIKTKIILDTNFIEYISYPTKNETEYDIHKENINLLLTGENLDLHKLIDISCTNGDEVLFNTLISYAKHNNIEENELLIDVDKLLDIVMLKVKTMDDFGANIMKKLLSMKAKPKKSHIDNTEDNGIIEVMILFGLQMDDCVMEKTAENKIVVDFDKLGIFDTDKLYEYCKKYNFFPVEYKKYFGIKYDAHNMMNIFFNKKNKDNKINETDVIKLLEESKIIPKISFYDKAIINDCEKLTEYLENKYKMYPGLDLLIHIKDDTKKRKYINKFLQFHKITHLISSNVYTETV